MSATGNNISIRVEQSAIDNSVNFVDSAPAQGYFESRYVRRCNDYFIAYLSVQSACNLGCEMCHLTASKQKKTVDATETEIISQAKQVLEHYQNLIDSNTESKAKYVHFNFMSRGEPLNSAIFRTEKSAQSLLKSLKELAESYSLPPHFLISTIMPQSFKDLELTDIFTDIKPSIYYSFYSTTEKFRSKWLPMAMQPLPALKKLSKWNKAEGHIKVHYAFIKDENDSYDDIFRICDLLINHQLYPDVNIVRYNPYSPAHGQESPMSAILQNAETFRVFLGSKVKIVTRVGNDVKASCGMFIEK